MLDLSTSYILLESKASFTLMVVIREIFMDELTHVLDISR